MRILLIIAGLFSMLWVNAQQWVQFSQQADYDLYVSPAFSGYQSNITAALAHRSQYVGLGTKSIGTQYASFAMPFVQAKIGAGFRFVNDFIGYQRYSLLELSGAYHPLTAKNRLSIGVGVGFVQLGIDGSKLTAPEGTYLPGQVIHNDPNLSNIKEGGLAPTFSMGVIYGIKNFDVGVAVQNINSPKISFSSAQSGTKIFISRTINMYASYVIDAKNVKITPSIQTKTDFVKWQAQVLTKVGWRKIIAGVGFRGYSGLNNDAVIGLFGFKLKEVVHVQYSYDYNVSYLNNSNSGSHEVSLKLVWPKKFEKNVKTNSLFNPRFL